MLLEDVMGNISRYSVTNSSVMKVISCFSFPMPHGLVELMPRLLYSDGCNSQEGNW